MEGKWTTNNVYFYFSKVNYSWKLYCKLAVPKVALRMIFLILWALGVIVKLVAITFGIFPLHIQCPSFTYFSEITYLVALSKLWLSKLFWVIPFISTLHWKASGSIVVLFTCMVCTLPCAHACTCTHTHNIRKKLFKLWAKYHSY